MAPFMFSRRRHAAPTILLCFLAFVLLTGADDAQAAPPVRLGAHTGLGVEGAGLATFGLDAGLLVLPELSLDARGEYAQELSACRLCVHIRAGVGPTLHDPNRQGFVSVFAGYDWFYKGDPGWESAPELGLAFGSTFPVGGGVSLGPVAELSVVERNEGSPGVTRGQVGIGGKLDLGAAPAREPQRGPLGVSAGLRAFVAAGHGLGVGGELGYSVLPELELGAQAFSILQLSPGHEYCDRCSFDDDRVVGFVEGRLPVTPLLTPYARVAAGAGWLQGTECEYDDCTPRRRIDGVHPTIGGELGLEVHGSGLSARVFALGFSYPEFEKQAFLGGGLQLGARL